MSQETNSKVPLVLDYKYDRRGDHPHFYCRPVIKCLPFFRNGISGRVHRVRSAHLHYELKGDTFRYMSVKYWCGNIGFVDGIRKSSLFAIAPDHAVFCATCEGRAVGAGLDGARTINGRTVIYSPRI